MAGGFTHTTGFAPELLYPGIKAIWGQAYKQVPKLYEKFMTIESSTKRFEKEQGMTGFSLAGVKDEGDSVSFGRLTQGFQKEYVHTTYGLGATITREMAEDDQYNIISQIPRLLAEAMQRTEEVLAHAVLNSAFDTAVTGADGSVLCATAHANAGSAGGTQANRPTTASDLTQASLEAALIDIDNFRDENAQRIIINPRKVIVSRSDRFNLTKILETKFKVGSADNDVNVIANLNLEPVVSNYLTDQDAWFITTDALNGLKFIWRRRPDLNRDNDADTQNLSIITTSRFDTGYTDWRTCWGSPGA